MDVTCPACGGVQVKRVPVIWREVASGKVPSSDVLAAVMVKAHPRHRVADTLSDEGQVHLLTQELGPPRKLADPPTAKSCRDMSISILLFFGGFALVILGIFRLASEHLKAGQVIATLFGGVLVAAVIFVLVRASAPKPTFKEYENRVVAWECMYLCIQCGNRFCQDI